MYLLPFKNQYRDHDFTLISDCIKEYFPVGKGKRLTPTTISSSPRFKKMSELVNSEFLDEKAYRAKWGKLTARIKKAFKTSMSGYPDMMGGGFIGEIIFLEDKQPDFIRQKSLRFYISIIGPFFSIHGVDSSTAILSIDSAFKPFDKGNFATTHALTLSPKFEYTEMFNKLEDEIREYFPGFLFVPYQIGMSTVKNISMIDDQQDPRIIDTIYEGLYGQRAVYSCLTRGDKRYGWNDWIKPFDKKEKALINLMTHHVINPSLEITVHKVWKLQKSKRLESFATSGNLMFGMDLFDVIDLSDKSTIIVISEKERRTPSSAKYKINQNVIELMENISLKIIGLTRDSLTLHLLVDFQHEDVSVRGAMVEMEFLQMKKIE